MQAVSEAFVEAVRDGGYRVHHCYVTPPNGAAVEVPLVGYSITAARGAVARYSGTVTLSPDVPRALVEPYGATVRVTSGFLIGGSEQTVPVGTLRIDDVDEDESGALQLTCVGFEKQVEDARFRRPYMVENVSIVNAIGELLSVAGRSLSVRTLRDAAAARVLYERERWQAIDGSDDSLSRALGVETYCDADGGFVIRDVPTIDDAPVWTVDAGQSGVLVGYRLSSSRQGVYNSVSAENDRLEQDAAEIYGFAQDDDPGSATYIYGPFGEVPRFYASPLLGDASQATDAARALLAESRGLLRSLSLTSTPNPALECGDVIAVVLPDRLTEYHLIDSISHSDSGAQSLDTRSTAPSA